MPCQSFTSLGTQGSKEDVMKNMHGVRWSLKVGPTSGESCGLFIPEDLAISRWSIESAIFSRRLVALF